MANSVPAIKQEMLDAIGVDSVEELFSQVPAEHACPARSTCHPGCRRASSGDIS
jgi:glycine cleavage system pyridoxal-binding protein P